MSSCTQDLPLTHHSSSSDSRRETPSNGRQNETLPSVEQNLPLTQNQAPAGILGSASYQESTTPSDSERSNEDPKASLPNIVVPCSRLIKSVQDDETHGEAQADMPRLVHRSRLKQIMLIRSEQNWFHMDQISSHRTSPVSFLVHGK